MKPKKGPREPEARAAPPSVLASTLGNSRPARASVSVDTLPVDSSVSRLPEPRAARAAGSFFVPGIQAISRAFVLGARI